MSRDAHFSVETADRLAPAPQARSSSARRVVVSGCLFGFAVAALLVTASTINTAMTSSASDQRDSCPLAKAMSSDASGRILGFLSAGAAASSQAFSEADMGAPMSPAYSPLRVAKVLVFKPEGSHVRGVFVPAGMSAKVGDYIDFAAGRQDPTLPCHYIPNLVTRIR